MKNLLGIALLFTVLAPLAALDIDTGFGVNFGYNYTSLKMMDQQEGTYEQAYGIGGIGEYIFIDATYIEGSINFFFSNTSLKHNETLTRFDGFSGDYNMNGISIGLGLLLKYPFYIGSLTFFPLFGFEGFLYVSQSFSKDYDWDTAQEGDAYGKPSYWNSFWIQVGAGIDYDISGLLFIRGELLADIKLPSALDNAYMKNEKFKTAENNFKDPSFFGMGVTFRIALGVRLSTLLGYPSTGRAPRLTAPDERAPAKKAPSRPKKRDPNVYRPQD